MVTLDKYSNGKRLAALGSRGRGPHRRCGRARSFRLLYLSDITDNFNIDRYAYIDFTH